MIKNFIELKKITPNYLILLICYSQFVLFCCNSATFNIRELVTALSWLPLLMSVFYILKINSFYYFIFMVYTFETFCNVVHTIFLEDQITASSIFTLLNTRSRRYVDNDCAEILSVPAKGRQRIEIQLVLVCDEYLLKLKDKRSVCG